MTIANSNAADTRVLAAKRAPRALLWRVFSVALAAVCVWTATIAAPTPAVSEYAVKAAVLFKVTKFIEWPAATFANDRSTLVICVVGADAPLSSFESLESNQLGARPIDVRLVTGDMLDLRQCQVAFFPTDSGADVDYALSKLEGMPVLTVGETEQFAQRGGTLALVTREQRVRFTVNLAASKRSRLKISSQLLNLATVIEEGKR